MGVGPRDAVAGCVASTSTLLILASSEEKGKEKPSGLRRFRGPGRRLLRNFSLFHCRSHILRSRRSLPKEISQVSTGGGRPAAQPITLTAPAAVDTCPRPPAFNPDRSVPCF